MALSKHAEEQLRKVTIYAQICMHTHIHVCVHAYIYIYTYMCIYINIYKSVHIHTCTYIHTHAQHVQMHARKHVWNHGVSATAPEVWLDTKKLCTSSCPMQSGGGLPSVASSPIACLRGTMDKRRTTTTISSSSHHHDSAHPRLQQVICNSEELIHPVHGPPKLRATEVTPWNEVTFLPFWRGFCLLQQFGGDSQKKMRAILFVSDKFYLTKYRPRMEKSHSKRHELSFCGLVSIVIVLTAPQKSNFLHHW